MAEWLRTGLQIREYRFDSGRRLQYPDPTRKPMPFDTSTLTLLIGLAFIAGLVRGFAGFGGALIYVPVASAIVEPQIASAMLWLMDTIPTLPIAIPALKKVEWKTVWPVFIGNAATVGVGVWWLTHGDPIVLRWAITAFILLSVAFLWSGWRYHGSRPFPLSLAVGGFSGFFGGAAQVSGPPVLIYWLAGTEPAALIRANVITLFTLTTITSGIAMWLGELFIRPAIVAALLAAPAYAAGLIIGQRLFGKASDTTFRRLAFSLILMAALISLPLFDNLLR